MFRRFVQCVTNSTFSLRKTPLRTFAAQKEIKTNASVDELPKSTAVLTRYTTTECEKILGLVNSLQQEDLERYGVSKGRANKLIMWRNRNGALRTMEDILLVEGFGWKAIDKLCQSLSQQPTDKELKKPQRARLGAFLTPALDTERRELIRSCVSIRIGVSSVTWARVELPAQEQNAPCQLTHWHHHDICEKKLHLNELVQRCLYVDHMIPAADCYVFENPQMVQASTNPGNAEQQNISIQKAQISAILSFAVARRSSYPDDAINASTEPQSSRGLRVYYLRRFLTARLFKHLVGTERVSSEETVLNMMRTHYNVPEEQDSILEDVPSSTTSSENMQSTASDSGSDMSLRRHIQFDNEQRKMFARAERYHREFLGQALLLNVAFVRLALLQDSQSIAAVSRLPNKDKELSVE